MIKFTYFLLGLLGVFSAFIFWGGSAGAFSRNSSTAAQSRETPGETVWIARADGGQSCSPDSAQSLDKGAEELKKSGVRVLDSRKGGDGKMHMQMCGAPTGSTNAYLVPREDLPKAAALGFLAADKK